MLFIIDTCINKKKKHTVQFMYKIQEKSTLYSVTFLIDILICE